MNPGNCNPIPCTSSTDNPFEFSEATTDALILLLDGVQKKCNGVVLDDFPRDNCLLVPASSLGDEVVDVNTIWTAATVPNGGVFNSLSIEQNAKLTLMPDVSLSFPVDGALDVNEGSTLINYGQLTSCDDHWEGVSVWGNGATEPISEQGLYIGKPNSIVKNAKIGIQTINGSSVLNVDHAKFFNNEIAIKLNGVVNYNDPMPTVPNESRIKFSEFRVDESMSGNLTFKSFVDLHKMNMNNWDQLRRNEFYLTQPNPTTPNWGIISRSSNITVGFNKLEGLHTGLAVEDGFPFVFGNNIIDSKYGMFLRGVTVNRILLNEFHLGNLADNYLKGDCNNLNIPNCTDNQQYGIIMESAISGFKMTQNVFKTEQGNPFILTIGTLCTDMGENDYQIRDNFFSELTIANVAHKLNGRIESVQNDQNGLKYLCNQLTYNTSDIYVSSDPSSIIQPRQGLLSGSQSLPAYNKFSFSVPSASWDYRNHHPSGNTSQYVYYFDPNDPNTVPREGHYENTDIDEAEVLDDNYCFIKPSDPGTGEPGKGKLGKEYPSIMEKTNNRNKYFEAYQAYQVASLAKEQAASQNNETLLEQKSKESQYYRAEADGAAYQGYLYAVLDTTGGDADVFPFG